MPKKKIQSVALEAHSLVHGQKQKDYGPVEDSFRMKAAIATILCKKLITPGDLCRIMIAIKMTRESISPLLRDSLVDTCGYADLLQQLKDKDCADEDFYTEFFERD
jgi:hypothetical protein